MSTPKWMMQRGQKQELEMLFGDLSSLHAGVEGLVGFPYFYLILAKRVEDCEAPDSKSELHTQLRNWRTIMDVMRPDARVVCCEGGDACVSGG